VDGWLIGRLKYGTSCQKQWQKGRQPAPIPYDTRLHAVILSQNGGFMIESWLAASVLLAVHLCAWQNEPPSNPLGTVMPGKDYFSGG
jgi:hypothetical protein